MKKNYPQDSPSVGAIARYSPGGVVRGRPRTFRFPPLVTPSKLLCVMPFVIAFAEGHVFRAFPKYSAQPRQRSTMNPFPPSIFKRFRKSVLDCTFHFLYLDFENPSDEIGCSRFGQSVNTGKQ